MQNFSLKSVTDIGIILSSIALFTVLYSVVIQIGNYYLNDYDYFKSCIMFTISEGY